jgi:exoribonuclease R
VRADARRTAQLRDGFAAIRTELRVPPDYPAAALAEAGRTARQPRRPPQAPSEVVDATDLPFVTLDPLGSTDLDQAMHLSRRGRGNRVHYAIADVASFVPPGGPLDVETHARAVTLYSPDLRTPLHPDLLGEGAASLLPDGERPAVLWRIDLDHDGAVTEVDVRRARVRSRAQLDYDSVQRDYDAGRPDEWLVVLREIGELRQEMAEARGAVDVRVPDQEIDSADGHFRLVARVPAPVESWNAQISLLTGMCAAEVMLAGRIGVLRTMPEPAHDDLAAVRRTATALGIDWPKGVTYPELVRSVDPSIPANAAFLEACTTLLRGAGYTAFDGELPRLRTHSAVAAAYAHVTAPLRRLVDRYGQEVAVALCADAPVPEWVRAGLAELPAQMQRGDQRARALDRACVDFMEAVLLEPHVGEVYTGVVVQQRGVESVVQLSDPPARLTATGDGLELGHRTRLRLVAADPPTRTVRLVPA